MLTVIGMGTVFVSLFALAVLMRLLDRIAAWRQSGEADRASSAPERGTEVAPAGRPGEDNLLPVIAAAVGAYLGAQSGQVFLIPVERPDRSRWIMDGRVDSLSRAGALATEKRS